jgi:hypothetical protein
MSIDQVLLANLERVHARKLSPTKHTDLSRTYALPGFINFEFSLIGFGSFMEDYPSDYTRENSLRLFTGALNLLFEGTSAGEKRFIGTSAGETDTRNQKEQDNAG